MSRRNNNIAFPPPYSSQPRQQRKIRYTAISPLTNHAITRANMLDWCLALSVGADATFERVTGSVKLTRVQLWGVGSTGVSSVTLEWTGPYMPDSEVTDTGNPMRPAHISSAPPKNSYGELWSTSTYNESDVLFQISLNTGDVMDLSFEYVVADGPNVTVANTTAIATAGIYYGCLGAPTLLVPTSLFTAGV